MNWRLFRFAHRRWYNAYIDHIRCTLSKGSLSTWKEWSFISNVDASLVRYLGDNDRYADLINGFVFHGRQVVTGTNVEEVDSRKTGRNSRVGGRKRKYRQRYRDSVRKLVFGVNCVIIAVENQDLIHYVLDLLIVH